MSAFLEMKEEHIEMKIKKEEPDYEDHLAISPVPIPVRGDKTEILQIKKEKIEPDYEDHLDGMGTLAVPLTDGGLPEIQSENPEIKLEEGRHLDPDDIVVVKLTDGGLLEINSENPEVKLEEGRHLDQDEIVVKLTDGENTLNEEDSWDFDTFLQLRHQNILVLETNYSVSVIEESQMRTLTAVPKSAEMEDRGGACKYNMSGWELKSYCH
ncbi:hypothetical protein GDO86_011967 [Hymenochirus boettgeri]|uniref:Uncharacterized protein n=1 Tax=Hymenochirus boettgeri TaxID=247094 RepID=A0A8T2JIL2_9PIPI|nr:hypothetical protein GDO86_011967 [Hymenochirus boettgeri]